MRYLHVNKRRPFLRLASLLIVCAIMASPCLSQGQGNKGSGGSAKGQTIPGASLPADVLARSPLSAVVGRPTANSIALNLYGNRDQEVYIEYDTIDKAPEKRGFKTTLIKLAAGVPAEIAISGLSANTEYGYRIQTRITGQSSFSPGTEGRFMTQRAQGSTFSFEIIGDSHPERSQQFDPNLYAQVLTAVANDEPDFFLTIGDDFSVDTLGTITKQAVNEIYARQRLYLSIVGSNSALFLVNGNHEQASLANHDGTADNVAVWGQNARNAFFPEPAPDGFYTGDETKLPFIGYLRDYYAWTWGDALFVVIDPYWHSPGPVDNVLGGGEKRTDLWDVTLGDEQYAWLKRTLETSKATYKFVFAHHVLGTGRGGIEEASLYEWGGKSQNGKYEFTIKRPGWGEPIQALMARTKVTAFVQGHDHIFASQVLDGVAYISLAEPADPNYALNNADAYKSGTLLPSSGRVRFTVSPKAVTIEYLRSWLPGAAPGGTNAAGTAPSIAEKAAYILTIPAGGIPGKGTVDPILGAVTDTTVPTGAKAAKTNGAQEGTQSGGTQGGGSNLPGSQAGKPSPAEDIAPARSLDKGSLVEFPGSNSASISTYFENDSAYYYEYGTDPSSLNLKTAQRSVKGGTVVRDRITGLAPGTLYAWRLCSRNIGEVIFTPGPTGFFTTARAPGSDFRFVIEADPHFDENSSGKVYLTTISLMTADQPDFVIDLGDTAMVEKLASDAATSEARMKLVRSYWQTLGSAAPIFMVAGNHDGEQSWPAVGARPEGKAVTSMRETWLTSAIGAPKSTYSVFSDTVYAFMWGSALFIVLDPFIAEKTKPTDDGWTWSLGKAQYDWLAATLASSKAELRFIFIHNLVGGKGKDARGGADWAGMYEWGGYSPDGKNEFGTKRPGWSMPIAALLQKYGVNAVFHGHDHFYAKEESDGITYQEVPQPSAAREQPPNQEFLAENGYSNGIFLPSPGYLRVTIHEGRATIEYVRSSDGAVLQRYEIPQ